MSSVKSSYTPGFFPLINRTNFLSRSSRCVLPFSRRVTTDALLQKLFRGCPWVYTQGDWTFWTQDMIWLAYVFYGWHRDFKRHFKTILTSHWCFARGCGFYFLDSFSFDVVVLVLCFVKVKKRGVCCNSTYLANRKLKVIMIICYGDEWRDSKSLIWSSLRYPRRRCVTKERSIVLLIKSKW